MIAIVYRRLSVVVFSWAMLVSVAAVAAEKWDFLQTQRWIERADDAAHSDVSAALCGQLDNSSRLRLLKGALRDGADEKHLKMIVDRYDHTLWERRRMEAALSAAMSEPRRRVGWVFPQVDCALSDPTARPWLD